MGDLGGAATRAFSWGGISRSPTFVVALAAFIFLTRHYLHE
jgi:hypothetical protein